VTSFVVTCACGGDGGAAREQNDVARRHRREPRRQSTGVEGARHRRSPAGLLAQSTSTASTGRIENPNVPTNHISRTN
jgi:hypothetical protein